MKTILMLAANPKNTAKLRLDEEVREIDNILQRTGRRNDFNLEQKWAIRPRDVQTAMLDFNPSIVHFSGHGMEEEGLALEDNKGQVRFVDTEALAGLFKLFSNQVECVILNACYSEVQAEAIAQYINYVIGMNQPIGDRAAIEFAVGFYNALGGGRSCKEAYEFGCNAIQMASISGYNIPVLKENPNLADASSDLVAEDKDSVDTKHHHIEARLEELHEEYESQSNLVRALKKSLRIDDLSPMQRVRLQKQIESAEAQREEIVHQIEELKNRI
ncbi:MAG: CHAT domain-containing protein [Cyanothece sp. SIO1E1]|nr:CHAT domain-containing protein [Cyanothece sp. SIO1E1]